MCVCPAMQKREVLCQAPNGSLVPDAWCEASEKPTTKQECYNDLCKGTWKVGEWTEVCFIFKLTPKTKFEKICSKGPTIKHLLQIKKNVDIIICILRLEVIL